MFENKEFLPVQSEYQVIEIFHRGGCKREYDRLLPEYPYLEEDQIHPEFHTYATVWIKSYA